MTKKINRKQHILETLAKELELNPGGKITTAALAKAVGVSEAALYRHFPSKARMFEGLIVFAEETVFSRINQILEEEKNTQKRCAHILYLLLGFTERNPGIIRLLLGDALVGERNELYERGNQFFEKVESQFKQVLREASMRDDIKISGSAEAAASLFVMYIEGRMHQFLRSQFKTKPVAQLDEDWQMLQTGIFV